MRLSTDEGISELMIAQIHGNVGPHSIKAMGVELAKCQKMGLCKAVGISNFSKDQM
jgi:diketogulonate reductase-like aldo/keto reductase